MRNEKLKTAGFFNCVQLLLRLPICNCLLLLPAPAKPANLQLSFVIAVLAAVYTSAATEMCRYCRVAASGSRRRCQPPRASCTIFVLLFKTCPCIINFVLNKKSANQLNIFS
ncbi:hypothetical protein [Methanimicrococcus hongohii]|uniref:hypothetical protein n=1 Tax=Methanimicrococcus hongohii TaxID=3028295 RepID=UPI00292D7C2D|nr:hypothetical protein [Methanimicrococcus sp. Hf6]